MVPLSQRTVVDVLQRGAASVPDRVAVTDENGQVTYRELLDRSLAAGGAFRALLGDDSRQQPVMLMLDDHLDHVLAWFGLSCIAAIEVPVNTAFKGRQLAHIAEDCEARILVIEAEYLDRVEAVADGLTSLAYLVVRGEPDPGTAQRLPFEVLDFSTVREAPPVEAASLHPWDLLGIMYTSGTTGEPKGVEVTQAQTYGRMWPMETGAAQPGDVTLVTLPLYHVIGQCRGVYNTLIAQGTVVIEPRFSASAFWASCRTHGVNYVPLVGAQATYLLRQPPRADDGDNPVERMCLGTTIPEADTFRERFAVELTSSYGLTEAGGVLVGRAEAIGCGWPRPDFEARLVDAWDVEVASGEVGELVLRPTEPWTVMAGYHKRPATTLEKWRNLWLHTGDLMYQRSDGMFVFVGRQSDVIRIRGENVSAHEVEQTMLDHHQISECAVVEVEGDTPGSDQEIKAVVVPTEGITPDPAALIVFLTERLPYYSVPRYLEFRPDLPRTESTRRVKKSALGGTGSDVWDRDAAGLRVTRDGLQRLLES